MWVISMFGCCRNWKMNATTVIFGRKLCTLSYIKSLSEFFMSVWQFFGYNKLVISK